MSDFNKNILQWVEYDNSIKSKNNDIKEIRLKRDNLEISIIQHIQENNLQDNIFNITSLNTQLKMNTSSIKESISYKFLENILLKYFNNDIDKTNDLLNFIKNNRNTTEKFSLKRN